MFFYSQLVVYTALMLISSLNVWAYTHNWNAAGAVATALTLLYTLGLNIQTALRRGMN